MAKKERVRLEDLTHEELLKKCYNQKRVIQELTNKAIDLNKEGRERRELQAQAQSYQRRRRKEERK